MVERERSYHREMFLIASTGRCGTMAVCSALDTHTDHEVEHEPEPLLLRESHRRHVGQWAWTPTAIRKFASLRRRRHLPYGQSLRCAPLVDPLMRITGSSRLVILCRAPDEYVQSAHSRGVMRRGDDYDRWRILAADLDCQNTEDLIGSHYVAVNRHLLAVRERFPDRTMVCVADDLERRIDGIAAFVGASIADPLGIREHLAARPNAGGVGSWTEDRAHAPNPAVRRAMADVWTRLTGDA